MLNLVIARLLDIGYELQADVPLIDYIIRSKEQDIKNFCNTGNVPKGLTYKLVDAVCGEFLHLKKSAGQLGDNFDFKRAVTSIKEGDVQIQFNDGTAFEEQFDMLISSMRNIDTSSLLRYRKMVW